MRAARFGLLFIGAFAPALAAQGAPTLAHAKLQYDARNWDAAKQEFTSLARATPNDITPVLYLGKIAMAQNDGDESVKQFEQCVKIDDNSADCHAWLGNALGRTAMRASKFKLPFIAKRTKKEFDRAVALDPTNIDGHWGQMQYYMHAPGFVGGSMDKAREQAPRSTSSKSCAARSPTPKSPRRRRSPQRRRRRISARCPLRRIASPDTTVS